MGPTRRHTSSFETNRDLEFDFFLAEQLGMTVARMRAELSNDEYVYWSVYFGRKAQRQQLAHKGR
jgi:hypothetical protein